MKLIAFTLVAAALVTLATPALAEVPFFTATCASGFDVTSNGTGKVKIKSKKASIQQLSANAWQVRVGTAILDVVQSGTKITVRSHDGAACQVTSGSTG